MILILISRIVGNYTFLVFIKSSNEFFFKYMFLLTFQPIIRTFFIEIEKNTIDEIMN